MPANYLIREVTTDSITVDFDNGQWARLPIAKDQTREQILSSIGDFLFTGTAFDSESDVPVSVGESGVALSRVEQREQQRLEFESEQLTYQDLRAQAYPSIGDQLDALYWLRQGDVDKQAVIDSQIAEVKSLYPKDMSPITRGEFNNLLNGL